MEKNKIFSQSKGPLKKLMFGSVGSFLLVLIFPKSFKIFLKYWFADLSKNMLYIVIAGLLTNKIANFLIKDAPIAKRSTE